MKTEDEKILTCCTCGKTLRYPLGEMYYTAADNDWHIDDTNDRVLCNTCNELECIDIAFKNGDL